MPSPSSADVTAGAALPPAIPQTYQHKTEADQHGKNCTLCDLADERLGCLGINVVDDDVGTQAGVKQRICTAEARACAGNDDRLPVEADFLRRLGILGDL